MFDADGSGFITKDEFIEACRDMLNLTQDTDNNIGPDANPNSSSEPNPNPNLEPTPNLNRHD